MPAPIVLFVYNRPEHTRRTVENLLLNQGAAQSELYVFADGPACEAHRAAMDATRAYVRTIHGFARVHTCFREENLGLGNAIIAGVTEVIRRHGRVIVLEDDMLTAPHFLTFMNQGLDLYEHETRLASIHGYIYPVQEPVPDLFCLKGTCCWGWATWQRGWDIFNPNGAQLLEDLARHHLIDRFNYHGAYPFDEMLRAQTRGENNSWSIRWAAAAFLKDMYTLYPGTSLVHNIGLDGSGVHCDSTNRYDVVLASEATPMRKIPVEDDPQAFEAFARFFASTL